jgi:Ras-related protein Rab-5C
MTEFHRGRYSYPVTSLLPFVLSFNEPKPFSDKLMKTSQFLIHPKRPPSFLMTLIEKKYKVVLMGSSSVGKTSILMRFSKGVFSANQEPTIGGAFISREVQTEDGSVALHIWDTAGQERYRALIPRYSLGASAIVVVYDVTDESSFLAAQTWISESRENHPDGVSWFLVGNKCDLTVVVDVAKVHEYAIRERLLYWETSAKTGQNIQELFTHVARSLPRFRPPDPTLTVDPGQPAPAAKPCC